MSVGRVVSGGAATAAVAGCALLVIGIAQAGADRENARTGPTAAAAPPMTSTSIPAQLPVAPTRTARPLTRHGAARSATSPTRSSAAPTAAARTVRSTATEPKPTPAATTATLRPTPTAKSTPPQSTPGSSTSARAHTAPSRTPPPPARPTSHAAVQRGSALPVGYSPGSATRVITVVAHSTYSTTATLQAWKKAAGGGWLKAGHAVTAHLGADGMSRSPSESTSATPMGSFSLTRAFGHYSDPGTSLPYFQTTPADWWISEPGQLYNTHQRCSSSCGFRQGSPNENLDYITPFYNYAVVIDYNTRNAGTVRQGAGSAFFLHVTDGNATAGCIAIPQSRLVPIMRWLAPSAHPRILIGVS